MTHPAKISPDEESNGRAVGYRRLYQNNIFHCRPRYHGPRQGSEHDDRLATKTPLHVIYPDKYMSAGLSHPIPSSLMVFMRNHRRYLASKKQNKLTEVEPMLVYTSRPNVKQTKAQRALFVCTWILILFNIIVSVLIFTASPYAGDDYGLFQDQNAPYFDIFNLIITGLASVLLVLAMVVGHSALFFAFTIIYGLDAILNMIRAVTIPQLLQSILQIVLIECAHQLRSLSLPQISYTRR